MTDGEMMAWLCAAVVFAGWQVEHGLSKVASAIEALTKQSARKETR